MGRLQIEVDADNMLGRQFTELERQQLPFAIMQACNKTGWEVRTAWQRQAHRVFDRPTRMTINAVRFDRATKSRPYAEIYLRDEAHKGTPPANYLLPQVQGGGRRLKGMERLLQAAGHMPPGTYAVPGKGAVLDQHGNVRAGQVRQIISQLGAGREAGYTSNESEATRGQRLRREKRRGGGGNYFPVRQRRGRLVPGIYERITTGFGSAVRSIFIFTRHVSYQPRYDIFGMAERTWDRLMPFFFNRELDKAVQSSKFRRRR